MKKFIILIPVYNDWKSVSKLLDKIDLQTQSWDAEISIVIINDASTEKTSLLKSNYDKIKSVKILNMKENIVHQRCIATGLKYIYGEDRPEELNDFFKKTKENPNLTITGNRFKRSEGFIFRILYEIHKILTLVFTGKLIKFGNFSCLPKIHVEQLTHKPYLWNSYSSSIVSAITNRTFIPSIRGVRYVLPSKMNLAALIFHSLAIISVFRNIVIFRSIVFFFIYLLLIFNNISFFTLFPFLFLLIFVLIILKISMRSNIDGLNNALDNISSVEVLRSSNSR